MKLEHHARVKNGDSHSLRRKALQRVIDEDYDGNVSAFARSAKKSQSQIADTLAGRKPFGEKVARSIERAAALIPGILDRDPDDPNNQPKIFGAPITAEAAKIGREWAKLREPLRTQVAELILTLVSVQAITSPPQRRRSGARTTSQ